MICARKRRLMTDAECLEYVPADSPDVVKDEGDLQGVIPGLPPNYYLDGVTQGWCRITTILNRGVPAYRIYWQLRCGGEHFHVFASLFVGLPGTEDTDVWANGAEKIARNLCCKKITFETKRKGHIVQAMSWGATVTGVIMEKTL